MQASSVRRQVKRRSGRRWLLGHQDQRRTPSLPKGKLNPRFPESSPAVVGSARAQWHYVVRHVEHSRVAHMSHRLGERAGALALAWRAPSRPGAPVSASAAALLEDPRPGHREGADVRYAGTTRRHHDPGLQRRVGVRIHLRGETASTESLDRLVPLTWLQDYALLAGAEVGMRPLVEWVTSVSA